MRIRKRVNELMPEDLAVFPVWEFALEEQDELGDNEATVRPCCACPIDFSKGTLIVAARFRASDRTIFTGYLRSDRQAKNFGGFQPVIVTPRGRVSFWTGTVTPGPEEVAECYRRLGKSAVQLFPISFETSADQSTEVTRGSIEGFAQLEIHKHWLTRRKKELVKVIR